MKFDIYYEETVKRVNTVYIDVKTKMREKKLQEDFMTIQETGITRTIYLAP